MDLPAGTHLVKVTAAGYQPTADQAVKVTGGDEAVQNISLTRASDGTGFRIAAEGRGIKLSVDSKDIGPLPQELKDLAPGDPSAFALMGRLYARAVADFPGAGPGAIEAADTCYGEAIGRSPFDARLLLERGGFRLATGRAAAALADASAALRLEPRALAGRQLELEALLESGRVEEAAGSLRRLDEESARLRGYEPENGYEASLIRIDLRDLERARAMIAPSLFFLPGLPGTPGVPAGPGLPAVGGGAAVVGGGPLGGRHHHDGGGRLLREDLIEEGGLRLRLAGRLPFPEAVPVHAGLAHDGLDRFSLERLDGMVEVQLAPRTVVVDDIAEAHGPLVHRATPERGPI